VDLRREGALGDNRPLGFKGPADEPRNRVFEGTRGAPSSIKSTHDLSSAAVIVSVLDAQELSVRDLMPLVGLNLVRGCLRVQVRRAALASSV
jgi:hypothetical protein